MKTKHVSTGKSSLDSIEMVNLERKTKERKYSLSRKTKKIEPALIGKINESFENPETEDNINATSKLKKSKKKSQLSSAKTAHSDGKQKTKHRGLPTRDAAMALLLVIHRTDRLQLRLDVLHPLVQVHLMDSETGDYMPKINRSRRVTSFYEDSEKWTFILPIMTRPTDIQRVGSSIPVWEEMLVFNEDFEYIVHKSQTIIFFELIDFVSATNACQKYINSGVESGWIRIAWAFLRPLGANGHENFGSHRLRLQLFQPLQLEAPTNWQHRFISKERRNIDSSALDAGHRLMAWWKAGLSRRRIYPSTLHVSLRGINLTPEENMNPVLRSLYPNQMEAPLTLSKRHPYLSVSRSKRDRSMGSDEAITNNLEHSPWYRAPETPSQVPNNLIFSLPLTWQQEREQQEKACDAMSFGVQDVRFSGDGKWLAVAATGCGVTVSPVLVYRWPIEVKDKPWKRLSGHSRRVYSLSWAPGSLQTGSSDGIDHLWLLASASADGTVRVWWLAAPDLDLPNELRVGACSNNDQEDHVHVEDEEETTPSGAICCCVLGHPGFVYSAEFLGNREVDEDYDGSPRRQQAWKQHLLATGGFDGVVRLWTIRGRVARLMQELRGHTTMVNSVKFDVVDATLISADAKGRLICWRPSESMAKKGNRSRNVNGFNWTLGEELNPSGLEGKVITCIEMHPCAPSLLIQARDSCLCMLDLRSGVVTVNFHGCINAHEFMQARITPCGSLVLAGSEDGSLHIWNSETGETVKVYEKLGFGAPVASLDFHPHAHVLACASTSPHTPLLVFAHSKHAVSANVLDAVPLEVSPSLVKTLQETDMERLKKLGMAKLEHETQRLSRALKKLDSVTQPLQLSNKFSEKSSDVLKSTQGHVEMTQSRKGTANFRFLPHNVRGQGDGIEDAILTTNSATTPTYCVALYDYEPQRSDELSLCQGDEIKLLFKDSPCWWAGESLRTGKQGFFMSAYVTDQTRTMSTSAHKRRDETFVWPLRQKPLRPTSTIDQFISSYDSPLQSPSIQSQLEEKVPSKSTLAEIESNKFVIIEDNPNIKLTKRRQRKGRPLPENTNLNTDLIELESLG